ncbi:MAG TPA: hypothetical protein VE987_17415 [Polyangiaceae bacterium]|nr:hypothetical protein [Polyangiaceae bacterium]
MPPTSANKARQFAFVLDDDEHRMLTELSDRSELSAAEWLRKSIRDAYEAGGLESLPHQIKRAWDSLELEHVDYIRRCKLAQERHAPRPTAAALERRIEQMAELIEARAERKSDVKGCLKSYRSAIARALPGVGSVEKIERELEEKFHELWVCVDEWLDKARAGV